MLINLGAFYDGNGRDNYADVYNFRISVKKKLKDYKFGSQEWIDTNIEQEGYKLILNSASGVLDGSFDTNLRANNKALSMRIIGQLFTWLIGEALALEGASVPSSNTDGIYVFDIDEELNKQIVDTELKRLYVAIDPEPVFLVSKDANNRLEAEVHANGEMEIVSARGGTLTSWQGARVDNRLSHPALVDKVMTKYLLNENIVDKPVNKDLIRKALKEYQTEVDARKFITMASWVMRSTSGSIFIDSENNIHPGTIRTWLTNDGLKLDRYGTRTARRSKGLTEHSTKMFNDSKLGDPDVISYLTDINAIDKYFESGITVGQYKEMPEGESFKHVTKMKISNLAETANVTINNNSIIEMSDEQVNEIYEHISEDEYIDLIASFAEVWHNQLKD